MDCKDARLLLEFARPGDRELEASEAEVLRQHLVDCPDCAAAAQAERRADEHIGRAIRAVPVPEGLRARLLHKLGAERAAWYRRWFTRGAAAAAVLLLASLGAYFYLANQLPAVDVKEVYDVVNTQVLSAQEVEEAFEKMGVETMAPPRFKYHLLTYYGHDPLPEKLGRGPRVPHLTFTALEGQKVVTAEVYILPGRTFDLEGTQQGGRLPESGRRRLSVWPHPGGADYLYLIIYTSEKLDDVFKEPSRPV